MLTLNQQLSHIRSKLNGMVINSEELSGGIVETTLKTLTNIDNKIINLTEDISQNTYSITNKQNGLIAGPNITISGDIISSVGDITISDVNNELLLKQNYPHHDDKLDLEHYNYLSKFFKNLLCKLKRDT